MLRTRSVFSERSAVSHASSNSDPTNNFCKSMGSRKLTDLQSRKVFRTIREPLDAEQSILKKKGSQFEFKCFRQVQ